MSHSAAKVLLINNRVLLVLLLNIALKCQLYLMYIFSGNWQEWSVWSSLGISGSFRRSRAWHYPDNSQSVTTERKDCRGKLVI